MAKAGASERSHTRTLTTADRIEAVINLLAALANTPSRRMADSALCRALALTEPQLEEIIELVQLLADTRTGSRAVVRREGGDIVLEGTAALIDPLRLTDEEALAVTQALARCHLSGDMRERVSKALMPDGAPAAGADATVSGDALFGGFYQQIIEAIQDGVRCRISYRTSDQQQAGERLIDPKLIEVSGDAAYLIAWDVEKDAQRRYRLDRIAAVSFTEESVIPHPFQRTSTSESLRTAGSTVRLAFANRSAASSLDWAGLDSARGTEHPDGTFEAPVDYATEDWLFDRLLEAAGSIRIIAPAELRDRFIAYAQDLLHRKFGLGRKNS